jgi:membrane-associated phospholipid phosphatase
VIAFALGSRRSAGVTAVAYGVNQIMKFVVRRQRPVLEKLPPLTGTGSRLSYPSAHAATSFAAARSLSAELPRTAVYAAAAALALSRAYLGVHYPSDVVAGAALGDAVARLAP